MTEHKFTDEEIIRALETCTADSGGCDGCCYRYLECNNCAYALCADALDIINRQRAEIDDLKRDTIPKLKDALERANKYGAERDSEIRKAVAKKFAEMLSLRIHSQLSCSTLEKKEAYYFCLDEIDNLVKEMTLRCPNCKHFVGCEAACGGVACDEYTEGGAE